MDEVLAENLGQTKMITNRRQLFKMIEFLEENKDMATGKITKNQCQNKWEQLANELNILGPPVKKWDKWNRVWVDLKHKVRKKKAENANLKSTGGGPYKCHNLTDIEEAVFNVLQMNYVSNPPGTYFGIENIDPESENLNISQLETSQHIDENTSTKTMKKKVPVKKRKSIDTEGRETKRLQLFGAYANNLKELKDNLKEEFREIKNGIATIATFQEKLYNLKKDTYTDKMKLINEQLTLKKEKLKVNQQILREVLELKRNLTIK